MNFETTRATLDYYTGKVSEISRQLALAAIALVWIFKTDQPRGGMLIPQALYWPAACAIAALACDLFQYTYASIAWGQFNRRKEKEVGLNDKAEFYAPRWINWPSNIFFYLKLVLVMICYALLLAYLFETIVK